MTLKAGDTFFSESKWMVRNQREKIIDFNEPLPARFIKYGPQFVFLRPGYTGYFQRGQKRYLCVVLKHVGYAVRKTSGICREFKFTYEVKVIA